MSSCQVPAVGSPLPALHDEAVIGGRSCALVEERKPKSESRPRKKLVRRTDRDYSQPLRLAVQLAFLGLNVWIGVQFYQWVRWAETAGQTRAVERPAGVEGWLPIAGLMQLKYVALTRQWPAIHPAGLFLISAFLLMSFLLRKSFCSWLCPVGTLSEYLWKLGRYTFRRNFALPRWLDVLLRGTKYLLLGFFVYAVAAMPASAIVEFLSAPYGLIVDVRMLNFFRFLGGTAAFVVLGLIVASIFIQNFWCRYLCPYGALMGLVSMLSPVRIRRNEAACIDCAKCTRACPSALPVDKLVQIRSAECTGCLECVAVCPAQDALVLSYVVGGVAAPRLGSVAAGSRGLTPTAQTNAALRARISGIRPRGTRLPGASSGLRGAIPTWSVAAGIAVLFFGLVGYAKLSGHWDTRLPQQVYFELVPHASEAAHP